MISHTVPVKRKRIHYFSGFDPRGSAHYHRLCRDQATKQQPQGGVVQVGRREKQSRLFSRWQVTWRANADAPESVQTEHVFMSWDDQIRAHWSRSPWALLRDFLRTYHDILRHVGPQRVKQLYDNAYLTGIMPPLYLLGTLLLGMLTGLLASLAVGVWGWLLTLPVVAGLWVFGASKGLFWLLRIFTFIIRMGHGPLPGLATRTQHWVDDMVQRQQQDPVDEVLLVGHSVGTLVMMDAVDQLMRDPRWQALQQGRSTGMVTLGQCCPFVALVPRAQAFRDTLQRVCSAPGLLWWDVSARIDPLCFYNTHPLALSGVPLKDLPLPVMHRAKFFSMYEPANWARIRVDKLQTHFLYLMTPDKVGNFHFADVLYGPRSLAQQVAAQGLPEQGAA
jgi:pimeloyl-ACP methyl ester carboxylesterase